MFFRNIRITKSNINTKICPRLLNSRNLNIQNMRLFQTNELDTLFIPKTKKSHLIKIQESFSPDNIMAQEKNKRSTPFLFSNDYFFIPDYFQSIFNHQWYKQTSNGNSLNNNCKENNLGIIVGNGSVLSLLPEISADDVLLLDIDSRVHYFILAIKKMILTASAADDFDKTKVRIIKSILALYEKITDEDGRKHFYREIEVLDHYHFLSSKSRFEVCRKALLRKELLPVTIDLFDVVQMKVFCETLKQNKCSVSYINLTNVIDYDNNSMLLKTLSNLPTSNSTFTGIIAEHMEPKVYLFKSFRFELLNYINSKYNPPLLSKL